VLTERLNENAMSIAFAAEGNSVMNRSDLADLNAFVAVADQQSFRATASRLDVTPSALSHSMPQLEERLGVRLLRRTHGLD
jgi:Bacterial regulatory helix-turn-helix protein, lysR family